jgi:hypothetical protein
MGVRLTAKPGKADGRWVWTHQLGVRVIGHVLHHLVHELVENARDVVCEQVVREQVLIHDAHPKGQKSHRGRAPDMQRLCRLTGARSERSPTHVATGASKLQCVSARRSMEKG